MFDAVLDYACGSPPEISKEPRHDECRRRWLVAPASKLLHNTLIGKRYVKAKGVVCESSNIAHKHDRDVRVGQVKRIKHLGQLPESQ